MALQARIADIERIYTNAEFESLPEFDERYELIDGKLVAKEMPGNIHGWIIQFIIRRLAIFDPNEEIGTIWPSTTFDLGQGWMPMPDLGFVVASRVPQRSEKAIKAVPDLAVEIHSPSDLDSKSGRDAAARKIRQYQTAGVRIVWAVNPRNQTVEVYHPEQVAPVQILTVENDLSGEDVIPSFTIKVADLFKQ